MRLPLWYHAVWITQILIFVVLITVIFHKRLLPQWPSLFAFSLYKIITFGILWPLCVSTLYHALHIAKPYPIYSAWYLRTGIVGSAVQLWVALNILQRMPGSKYIPKTATLKLGMAATTIGIGAWFLSAPISDRSDPVAWLFSINLASDYTWCAVFLMLLIGTASAGYGFSLTGARVASGMLVKMLMDLTSAQIYANPNHTRAYYLNTAGCVVAVCTGTALYWIFTMLDASRASAALQEQFLQSVNPTAYSPAEKDGVAA